MSIPTVDVWVVEPRERDPLPPLLFTALSDDERGRARRIRAAAARHRFVVMRAALRVVLAQVIRTMPSVIAFRTEPAGKPVLDASMPPVAFSVSHTAGLGLIGVTRPGPIGVDVERIRSAQPPGRLFERVAADSDTLASLDGEERRRRFTELWARREAIAKADGSGLAGGISRTEMSRWCVKRVHVPDGYVGVVALPSGPFRVREHGAMNPFVIALRLADEVSTRSAAS